MTPNIQTEIKQDNIKVPSTNPEALFFSKVMKTVKCNHLRCCLIWQASSETDIKNRQTRHKRNTGVSLSKN